MSLVPNQIRQSLEHHMSDDGRILSGSGIANSYARKHISIYLDKPEDKSINKSINKSIHTQYIYICNI